MRRIPGLALVGLACLAFASCEPPQSGKGGPVFHQMGLNEALAEAGRQKKMVMVDFGASWCGPCRQMEHTTFSDPDVQRFLRDYTIAIKVDIDEQRELAQDYGISGVPTVMFLTGKGEQMYRMVGYKSPQQFLNLAAKLKT